MEAVNAEQAGFAHALDAQPVLRLVEAAPPLLKYEEELWLVERYLAHVLDLLQATGRIGSGRRDGLAASLRQVFRIELAPGRLLTLPDLLLPGRGKRTISALETTLQGLDEVVAYRLRSDLRVFLRALAEQGAHVLYEDGIDLKKRYGPLVNPIGRLRRPPPPASVLPPVDAASMRSLYGAMFAWPTLRGRQGLLHLIDWRTVLDLLVAFEAGLREGEIVLLVLGEQVLDPVDGMPRLVNPLRACGVKGGGLRDAYLEKVGLEMLNRFLAEVRPRLAADPWTGTVLPSSRQSEAPRTTAGLRFLSGDLLAHLKEQGLLDPSFTFHTARKVFARRYLETHPGDVAGLLERAGWDDEGQLGTYLALRPEEAPAENARFQRLLAEGTLR